MSIETRPEEGGGVWVESKVEGWGEDRGRCFRDASSGYSQWYWQLSSIPTSTALQAMSDQQHLDAVCDERVSCRTTCSDAA